MVPNVEPTSEASSSNATAALHEHLLLVAGFLGGIAFTALVLILQSSVTTSTNSTAIFEPKGWGIWGAVYFNALTMLVGGISVAFITASVAGVALAAGVVKKTAKKRDEFVSMCFVLGWFGLLIVIPLLLFPFFWGAALVVGVVEAILLFRYLTL